MNQFSDDCRWWWDGTSWLPTLQLVLPQLPATEFERSGRLEVARGRRKDGERLAWANMLPVVSFLAGAALIPVGTQASLDYRAWTLEQMALATSYLLGPDEPMTAGEGGTLVPGELNGPPWKRDLAMAVTAAHVLVFRIDSVDGQPRWVSLAARPKDVTVELKTGLRTSKKGIVFGPALIVSGWSGQWTIQSASLFKPETVVEAWRQAARGPGRGLRPDG